VVTVKGGMEAWKEGWRKGGREGGGGRGRYETARAKINISLRGYCEWTFTTNQAVVT